MMNKFKMILLAALITTPLTVNAAELDPSQPLICATLEIFECTQGSDCLKGQARNINAPQFIRLDLAEKVARAERADGEEVTSAIETIGGDDGGIILQGMQSGRGWSMTIDQTNGQMTLTASSEGIAFVLFGACTGV